MAKELTVSRAALPFPVVGLGASAGGIEALEQFFTAMPPDSGMAFVVIQHLDPHHKSALAECLQRNTQMPVVPAQAELPVEPNHVYVIVPNSELRMAEGTLDVQPPSPGARLPIDTFFRSLAQTQQDKAIGIVLSGMGSEGALGLTAIKGENGMVMVQTPLSAQYDSMPRNAIATDLVDYVLPPSEMPEKLLAYIKMSPVVDALAAPSLPEPTRNALHQILALLHRQTGQDFSAYKHATVARRIGRRMNIQHLARLEAYLELLESTPAEVETLFRDLLIGVTNFFRDPEAFAFLERQVIPSLIESLPGGEPLRVWVPGCSTGEEAYSIAMLLQEYLDEHPRSLEIQIFATDINLHALEKARRGLYPATIAGDVTPKRLARFFVPMGDAYQVAQTLRDKVIFAAQNFLTDPPFSRLDLLSCRNVLIYLDTKAQQKSIALFHYALKAGGYLWLGSSESLGEQAERFTSLERHWRFFRRPEGPPTLAQGLFKDVKGLALSNRNWNQPTPAASVRELTHKLLLEIYAPDCVIATERGEALYFHGRTGVYLEPAAGEPTLNVLRMAREGLRIPLTIALQQAVARQQPVVQNNVTVKTNGEWTPITLTVQSLRHPAAMQGLVLIVFQPHPQPDGTESPVTVEPAPPYDEQRVTVLEDELRATREYSQVTTEELKTANEELTVSNEELMSINEELQSTNEELQTSKEALQSVNEELSTVNYELSRSVADLTQANADINNLLDSMVVGLLFLDRRLQIRRFNPPMQALINLIASDVGRPLQHLVSRLEYPSLTQDCATVLATLQPRELEVRSDTGRWYMLRIRPYLTLDNIVDGLVLTCNDITSQKQMQAELEQHRVHLEEQVATRTAALEDEIEERKQIEAALRASEEQYRHLFTEMFDGFALHEIICNADGQPVDYRFLTVNAAFERLTGLRASDLLGKTVLEALPGIESSWIRRYGQVALSGEAIQFEEYSGALDKHYEVRAYSPERGKFAAVFADITARKQAEAQIKEYADHLEQMVEEKVRQLDQERAKVIQMDKMASLGQLATSVAHELNQPLTAITLDADYLIKLANKLRELRARDVEAAGDVDAAHVEAALDLVELEHIGWELQEDVQRAQRIINHLRGFGRIAEETLSFVDLNQPLEDSFILIEVQLRDNRVTVDWQLAEDLPFIEANPHKLEQVFINLIGNAEYAMQEAAEQDGREKVLTLSTRQEGDWIVAEVRDNGYGMSEAARQHLFEPFFTTKPEGHGTGLGLSICHGIVTDCGGEIACESAPGAGTAFTLRFPVASTG